jgi:hypothetical protein
MKLTDKVIAALLVSTGIFSLGQATQYVQKISAKQKKHMLTVAGNVKQNHVVFLASKLPLRPKPSVDQDHAA